MAVVSQPRDKVEISGASCEAEVLHMIGPHFNINEALEIWGPETDGFMQIALKFGYDKLVLREIMRSVYADPHRK